MAEKRYEITTMRRTSRFTVWAVYDNRARMVLRDTSSRDRENVAALVKTMNREETNR